MKRSAGTRRYKTREQCEVEQATTVTANEKELNFYHETPGLGKVTVLQVAILAWTRKSACGLFLNAQSRSPRDARGCGAPGRSRSRGPHTRLAALLTATDTSLADGRGRML